MSVNQSRAERTEGQFRKPGRSGNSVQQRGYIGSSSGGGGGRVKGGASVPPSFLSSSDASPSAVAPSLSTDRSFNKPGNGQGNQYMVNSENVSSEASDATFANAAYRAVQIGAHFQTVSPGFSDAPAPGIAKPVETPIPKGAPPRAIPKAPSSQSAVAASPVPSAPTKEDASSSFTLQFGSINPGMINGVQIPARTSSAPPNLDEQIRDQARPESRKPVPPMPIPSAPKQQQQQQTRRDVNGSHQSSSGESHSAPQVKKDVSGSIPSASAVPASKSSSVLPISGMPMPMPMPFQPQQRPVPQFNATNPQMQSPGLAANSLQMTMTLPVGNSPQVPQQIYVPGIQSHFMQQAAMVHQGQGLGFAPLGHPLPPQLGNLGIGIGPQFPQQQPAKFGGGRKTPVKITHPETHEELHLEKDTDAVREGVTAAQRPLPNVITQSQSVPTYNASHQMNFFSPIQQNSYGHSQLIFPSNVPLASAHMHTNSQAPSRYNYTARQVGQNLTFTNQSMVSTLPSGKHTSTTPLRGNHEGVKLEGFPVPTSLPTAVQVTVKPPVLQNEKYVVSLSSTPVVISIPAAKAETPNPVNIAANETISNQRQTEINPYGHSQQLLKSGSEQLVSLPEKDTNLTSDPSVISAQATLFEDSETPTVDLGSVVAGNDGRKNKPALRSDSFNENPKKPSKKDIRNSQKLHQLNVSCAKGAEPSPKADNRILLDIGATEPVEGKVATEPVEGKVTPASGSSGAIWEKEATRHLSLGYADSVGSILGEISIKENVPFVTLGPATEGTDAKSLDANLSVINADRDVRGESMLGVTELEKSEASKDSPQDSYNVEVHPSFRVVLEQDKRVEICGEVKSSEYYEADNKMLNGSNCIVNHKVREDNMMLNEQNNASLNLADSKIAAISDLYSASDVTIKCELTSSKVVGSTDFSATHMDKGTITNSSLSVENKSESKVFDSSDGLVTATRLGKKEKPSFETLKPKITSKKKNRKELFFKADAADTSDLYNAYKAPEIKHENINKSENINSPTTVTNIIPIDDPSNDVANEEDMLNKMELDDWENAADISTPKLKISENGQRDVEATKHHDDDGLEATGQKKYSRDFLMTLSQHFTQLPVGFGIGSDVPDSLFIIPVGRSPCPSPGRIIDRPSGASRADRRMDDEKWIKSPVTISRDHRLEAGNGTAAASVRPGQGPNHGVLRVPRGQLSSQFGGILSGPMQSQGGMPRNNSDADRWQRARGLIPSPQTPLQMMHKAEKKYEVGKVSDEEEAKQRQLKSILNKLTPQNFDKLFTQVKEVNIDNADTLKGVISQIFDKALMEPTFCEMYANFCFHLADELPDFNEDNEKITFKRLLLNKCQEEFEKGEREQAEANKVEMEGEINQSKEAREEKRLQARRRMLGNIRLIGELFKKKMLTERIMHECIKKLLGQYQNHDEEDIEALCKLMSTIGEMIDHPKARVYMDTYFNVMTDLSTSQKLSSRVRFMLRDAIDLRKNKWQQRRKVEGPKKIDEVHRDAAQERHAQSSRLARGPVINNAPRRGQVVDYGSRGPTSLISPSSQLAGGLRGLPLQVRGYGNQDVRSEDRHQFEGRSMSLHLPRSTDDSLTLGPQGGLAREMSVRGYPSVSNSNVSAEISPAVGEHRRMMSGINNTNYASDRISGATYDLLSPQERHNHNGSGDSKVLDRTHERSATTILPVERNHGTSSSNLTPVAETRTFPEEVLREKSISAIKEFYSVMDENEVALCVKELNAPSFYPSMISLWITDSFERKDKERDLLAKLIISLCNSRDSLLNQVQLLQGFEFVLSSLEDAVNDAPKAAEFLGRIFAKIILERVAALRDIGKLIHEGGEEPGRLREIGLAAKVLGYILETIRLECGDSALNEIKSSSGLHLEDFRPHHSTKAKKLNAFP